MEHFELVDNTNDLLSNLGQTPESFTGRILFMSMFNDISCDRKGNKDECLANARDKEHQDPEHIDYSVPRRAQYLHSAWKKHQDAVFWVDIDLSTRKGLTFYQTRSNAIILQGTLPAYCIPKVERLQIGEVLYEKSYISPRAQPKISLRHDHDRTKGNTRVE